MFIPAVNNCSK